MLKKIKVIGDGGAFDYNKVNSSFMITTDKGNILYDCGSNVFDELVRIEKEEDENIIKNIKMIIISHDDDDHCGSAKTLLFYMYFMHGIENTRLHCPEHMMTSFSKMIFKMVGSKTVKADIVDTRTLSGDRNGLIYDYCGAIIKLFKGNHHTETYGIIAYYNENIVAISGDTKADQEFETEIRQLQEHKGLKLQDCLIFHDYSYWNAPSRQVHACESDYEIEYSKEFRDIAIKYHNNKADIAGNEFYFSGESK
jgi:ribonuclease BN (tRNA processing enzyme)